ncbi:unnamed protein product [Mytilus coruscus]|uniref:G-protein coupled receptor GRL101 n=1 Tax=Mytilus coruscus TaxID=42192 RepID=A0A6J8AL14_MYTCO|nr:unnamed protein product [Mytilus coruscus]
MYGCPEDDWEMRYINLTLPILSNDMYWESSGTFYFIRYDGHVFAYSHWKDLHILGPYSKRSFQLNFCVRDGNDSSGIQTAQGNFCMYDIGKGCANGFKEGNITIRGYHIDMVGFRIHSGYSTSVTFCCKEDSNSTLSEVLPHDYPFVLLKGPSKDNCEHITDMSVSEDKMFMLRHGVYWGFHGTIPNVTITDTHIGISFCFYQPESYSEAIGDEELENPYPLSELYSLGRPVYSSPYVKSLSNNPNFVVNLANPIDEEFYSIQTRRPWLQIDLQQFINVTHVIKQDVGYFGKFPSQDLYGMYISIHQWDFVNRGAKTCFFGLTDNYFRCRRPITGQFVTLTLEYEYDTILNGLAELKVFGFPTGCGRSLGMITGDIKDYQIETSSNYKDIPYSRAMQGTEGWCSSTEDMDRWLMVDLIVPTKVQGVILHGWYQNKRMFIHSFLVEFGLRENNLIQYGEDGLYPKVFTVDTIQDVHILQKFLFLHEILTRYIKIKVIDPSKESACFKAEFIGCQVYACRDIWCKESGGSLFSHPKRSIDMGFASVRHIETGGLSCSWFQDGLTKMNIKDCQQRSKDDGYIGSVYDESREICCYYNTSSTNRHYKHLWKRNEFEDVITSERLCFLEFYRPKFQLTEWAMFPSILGHIDYIYSPMFPSNYPKGINEDKTVQSFPGMYLKLTIIYASFAETETEEQLKNSGHSYINPSSCKDTLTIDIGAGQKIQITRDNQKRYRYASFMATGDTIKIHFTSCFRYLMSENIMYQLKIESIASDTNMWKIRGQYGQYIELQFIELDVNIMSLVDSFVEVFDFDIRGERSSSFGRFTKSSMPHISLISSWHMIDVEFRVGNSLTGRGFLGLYTIKDTVIQTISNKSDCAATWANLRTSCYKLFHSNHTNQQKAEMACVREGGHLVSINSEEEMKFVHQLLFTISEAGSADQVYIGMSNNVLNGISQPDGYEYEQCAAIILNSIHNKLSWHDVPCAYDKIQYFMCETQLDTYDNQVTDDEIRVLGKSGSSSFNHSMFICGNGEIISQLATCDSYKDCSDNSDEKNCGTECSSSQYQCADGSCIHFTFYCDHSNHCNDGSDEQHCQRRSCKDGEWQCGNKQCIPAAKRCDVTRDCFDGSDEINCETCSLNSYQCYDKSCISKDRVCDTISDCPGGYKEDEYGCTYSAIQTSCEQWWVIGARLNGMYSIDQETEDTYLVYCEFNDQGNTLLVSTFFYYNDVDLFSSYGGSSDKLEIKFEKVYSFPEDMIKSVIKKDNHQCLQNVKLTCYYHDAISSDNSEEYTEYVVMVVEACNKRQMPYETVSKQSPFHYVITLVFLFCSCHCIGGIDWRQVDVNRVLTDNIVISNPDRLPFHRYGVIDKSYSDEGFYDVTVGPVVCKSEILKNVSRNQSLCSDGKLYNYTDHCIMRVNERSDIKGCRDMTHLQHCGNFTCPGLYRCQQSTTCLLFDEVCDNIRQCPHGDDEVGCDVTCPIGCSCEGFVFICHQKEVETIFRDLSVEARKLDLSSSLFPSNNFIVPAYTYLADFKLFNCSIANIMPYSFEQLMNLLHLDLSNNKLKVLQSYTFYGLTKLVTLNLKDNLMLRLIKPNAFMSLPNVKDLELSGTRIIKLLNGTFNGLENLEKFNITGNGLTTVEKNGFDGLASLLSIDLRQNDVTKFSSDIFSRLSHLTQMKTDSYIFCCLKPESVSAENCFPKMDEFSSCRDLMRNDVLRVCLWIIAINALFGNIGVILYRIIYEKTLLFKANWLFIMNLGVSDMLMGVYLGIIAFVDMYNSGNYILHDREWRDSTVCKFAGILAAISCEASVCFVMLTTFDCYLMVKFPFGRWRITYKTAKVSTLVCWLFVIIIAVVPIFETAYFSNMFYSRTAVCLALPFSRQKVSGWEYSTAIFVFFNCIAFIVIAWCQLSIYQIAKSSNRIMTKRTKQDLTLARRLFLIVLTDFLCWFPVGIMGILAMAGIVFPSEVYSWVAVFVMPLNAALNPFLYTFSTIKQKPNILGKMSSKIFQMSKVKDRRKDASAEIFMASVFINNAQVCQMRHITLRELFATRKLSIKESIRLVSQLTAAIAYLHHRYLTLRQPVSLDTLVVFMDRKTIERIKVISEIKDIRKELDTANDVDNIGQITKLVLRNTRKLPEKGQKY